MVCLTQPLSLSRDLKIFHGTDKLLDNAPVVILYGPSGDGSNKVSSRVQVHVLTRAGWQSYDRLLVSPSSALYEAVDNLPKQDQGDEISRTLAYTLLKYFNDLSSPFKQTWTRQASASNAFNAQHAATVASQLREAQDTKTIMERLEASFRDTSTSCVDVDVILPADSIQKVSEQDFGSEDDLSAARYGKYATLVQLLGEPSFIPTSRIRRAPSRPTTLSRKPTISRKQKESLRQEMCEFLDTEENYITKLNELIKGVVAEARGACSVSNNARSYQTLVNKLFPSSLDEVFDLNLGFSEAVQTVLDSTEDAAIADIQSTQEAPPQVSRQTSASPDKTGVIAFADCLLEWFPKLSKPYGDYIKAHSDFGQLVKQLMAEGDKYSLDQVREMGEQKLTSTLIEPVQRLPRYSLYIDNLMKQLPMGHPAIKKLLKAKDFIAEACSGDQEPASAAKIFGRMQRLVPSWPSTWHPACRFISAIDLTEVKPPFNIKSESLQRKDQFIAMLFAGHIVLLRKETADAMSARSLMVEIDNTNVLAQIPVTSSGLVFEDVAQISNLTFEEFADDTLLRTCPTKGHGQQQDTRGRPSLSLTQSMRTFQPSGSYEGRVSRFIKEVVKATVEWRFSEAEREDAKWEARDLESVQSQTSYSSLGLFSAVYELGASEKKERPTVTISVDNDTKLEEEAAGIQVAISLEGDNFYRLEVDTTSVHPTRDIVTSDQLQPVLLRRLTSSMEMLYHARKQTIAVCVLQHYDEILQALDLPANKRARAMSKTRSLRDKSHSPVKALTSLFGSGSSKDQKEVKPPPSWSVFNRPPSIAPPVPPKSSDRPKSGSVADDESAKVSLVSDNDGTSSAERINALEDTLQGYVIALQARRGNIVGRSLQSRSVANETMVNELYNSMLEQPDVLDKAAEAPVDVLFAAFEKFITIAWRDDLSSIIPQPLIEDLQSKIDTLQPHEYEDYLVNSLSELAPQNKRALKVIIALMADLMEGMSNDADRGALVATITEVLVCDSHAQDYIGLFDRLVEDHDVILSQGLRSNPATPRLGSVNSSFGPSFNPGSVSSKASSFGKRLGLGSLHRKNSRSENLSRVGSVLQGLGKVNRLWDPPSQASLGRTRSIDTDLKVTPTRPGSSSSRPTTAQSGGSMDPIQEVAHSKTTPASKRKQRRSSLSDLTSLPQPNTSPLWASPLVPNFDHLQQPPQPSPLASYTSSSKSAQISPTRSNAIRGNRLSKKENIDPQGALQRALPQLPVSSRVHAAHLSFDPPESQPQTPSRRQSTIRHDRAHSTVAPRGVLSERAASGNTPPAVTTSKSPSKQTDLRMPPPQPLFTSKKLQERMEAHREAVSSADSGLQAELAKIGDELHALPNKSPEKSGIGRSTGSQTKRDTYALSLMNITNRLKALETKQSHLYRGLAQQSSTLENDAVVSLRASETKHKELQTELREAAAENDLLYQQNNEELARVWQSAKDGNAMEEMIAKLKQAQDDALKARRDCAKLKRENAALKAQLGQQ